VVFGVEQRGAPYRFSLPVRVVTDKGETATVVKVARGRESFEIPVEGRPLRVVVDGDYSLMRRLGPKENPPVVARLLGDEKRIVVTPDEAAETYSGLVDTLRVQGFESKREGELTDEELRTSSVLVCGLGGPTLRRLFASGAVEGLEGAGFHIVVLNNPIDPRRVVAVAYADRKEEVDAAARKLFRYGKYSRLGFSEGTNIFKETAGTERGMAFALEERVLGIRPGDSLTLEEIIRDIQDRDVIYVGEGHKNFEDHRVQLGVIRALHGAGRKFGIGMEMFQQPYQQSLDDYIAGETGEREFLRSSEYFKRWGMEYNLYREILDFAREKGIPVVALNLKREIVSKVATGGLDALSEEERKAIPVDMDMSDAEYREQLMKVFQMHEARKGKPFEHFYQSQILWDETMAHAVDRFLSENPGHQMVVVVGQGHVAYGSGIPKRVHRLNGRDYAILVNSSLKPHDADVADYIIYAKPIPAPEAPKMMVLLNEKEGRVWVTGFPGGSVSERAGLREDDVLLSIDGEEITSIQDVRISLYDRKKGDTLKVKVRRKRFLLGDRELDFSVTL
jgi:uncharacterized iron-regulated protein